MKMQLLLLISILLLIPTGCSRIPQESEESGDSSDASTNESAPETTLPTETPPDWASVNDFLYQLQGERPDRIGETAFDLLVLSISSAGNSSDRIPVLKHSPGGEKIILCYLSIGQAEEYRFYWQPEWDEEPPAWLEEPDPDWRGDYWVRYWESGWQEVIFGTPDSYLDRIIELGYDGVYLDRVDAYWYFEEQGRETAAREMVDFVLALTEYARQKKPGFGVFPQNAEELGIQFPDYLATVTGIGVEDLYYGYPRDHQASPPEWTTERETILDTWAAAGKLVLTIDYTSVPEQISDAYDRSRSRGFIPYVADRGLGRLRINPGYEPD
ncbi:MAG: endo alpha-1,4 polygalactosaminidase [Anaerolineales bacterium]|nr:endo alpha-1,4 polygalactosaminidase [Anaerolineales bacterium]